jgi:antirestriction protein ArdC
MELNISSSTKVDVYQIVNDRIVSLLENGTVPWQRPWTDAGVPMNLLSKRPYRGINLWLLLSLNYERNLFLPWDQIKKVGGSVKKGETGHVVIYWKKPPKNEDVVDGEKEKQVPILRYYKVFNVSQCKDLPANMIEPLVQVEHNTIAECEAIIACMPQCPAIKEKENQAYYNIDKDFINMPKRKLFKSVEGYYTTLFHELVHSTGSEKRLNRKTITEMFENGADAYGIEELVAELGSAYLSSFTGILKPAEIKNSAAYINGWLAAIKKDKRFIVQASGQAQKAVDFIMNQSVDEAKEDVVPVVPLEEAIEA